MRISETLPAFALFSLALGEEAVTVVPVARAQSIAETAVSDNELSTLVAAATKAGFVDVLASAEELTLFAPTNEAFAKLDADFVATLLTPPYIIHLQALLSHHLWTGTLLSSNITDGLTLTSNVARFSPLGIGPLNFSVDEDDAVFVSGLTFEASQVIGTDMIADNGVIHKVDGVFVPKLLSVTLWEGLQDLLTGFETLKALIADSGLIPTLNGTTPITVFGVPDQVFAAVPEEVLASLNITQVLLNHVILGEVYPSPLLTPGTEVTTALGVTYAVSIAEDGETLLIGDVPVVQANIVSTNGIAHVIGGILLPPTDGVDPTAAPTATSGAADGVDPTAAPTATSGASTTSVVASVCILFFPYLL
jgi:transforming growth factor-beta-induced protein